MVADSCVTATFNQIHVTIDCIGIPLYSILISDDSVLLAVNDALVTDHQIITSSNGVEITNQCVGRPRQAVLVSSHQIVISCLNKVLRTLDNIILSLELSVRISNNCRIGTDQIVGAPIDLRVHT